MSNLHEFSDGVVNFTNVWTKIVTLTLKKMNNIKMDCFFCCFSFGVTSTLSLWFSVRVESAALRVCVFLWY